MPFTIINADFSTMLSNYYKYNALPQPLQAYLDALNKPPGGGNTPCCIQMSHALNAAGVTIPAEGRPQRRQGGNPNIMGGNGYYLLCVDELEDFLTGAAGATDYFEGNKVTRSNIKTMILGRQGILAFRSGGDGTYGFHTELWTGRQIVQSHGISGNMSEGSCFSQPRVLWK